MLVNAYELEGSLASGGRYTLHAELAAGGMGTVHLGRLHGAGGFARIVAIKRLHPHFASEPEFVSMLVDEASVACNIHHPNVVSTLDVVRQDGELLLVMDYIEGETLTRLLKYSRRTRTLQTPSLPLLAAVMVDTLRGLHAAHTATSAAGVALQIVHRDVSPHNVLVGVDGRARVHDFGIAKAERRSQTTRPGQIKGKFAYLSPEQIRGLPVDARTDVFAAGIMLWEGLAQRRLFLMDQPQDTIKNILANRVVAPSVYDSSIPERLDRILMKALAPRMDDRFGSAEEFADELSAVVTPAKRSEVATWVRTTAERRLAERARMVESVVADKSQAITVTTRPVLQPVQLAALPSFENSPMRLSVPALSAPTPTPSLALAVTWTSHSAAPERRAFRFGRFMPLIAAFIGIGVCTAALAFSGSKVSSAGEREDAALGSELATQTNANGPVVRPAIAVSKGRAARTAREAPPVVALAALANEGDRPKQSAARDETDAPVRSKARSLQAAQRALRAPVRVAAPAARLPLNRGCDVPYVVDAAGVRRVRKECL